MHEISSKERKPENVPLEFSIFNFAYQRTFVVRITALIEWSERKSIGKTNSVRSVFAFQDKFFSSTASTFSVVFPASDTPKATESGHLVFFSVMNSICCRREGFHENIDDRTVVSISRSLKLMSTTLFSKIDVSLRRLLQRLNRMFVQQEVRHVRKLPSKSRAASLKKDFTFECSAISSRKLNVSS